MSTVTGIRLSLIASPVLAAQERLRRRVPRAGRTADAPRIIRVVVVRWWPVRNGAAAGPASGASQRPRECDTEWYVRESHDDSCTGTDSISIGCRVLLVSAGAVAERSRTPEGPGRSLAFV